MTIKAIETQYKGHLFRSRLEARWAVFFDALGLRWEYEKEGYDLGVDGWYLPDFWLADWHHWVEIKPEGLQHQDMERCHSLAVHTQSNVLLLSGCVWPGEHCIYLAEKEHRRVDTTNGPFWFNQFAECRRCPGTCLLANDDECLWQGWQAIGEHTCKDHDKYPVPTAEYPNGRIMKAYIAARSARFEHGQSGAML